MSILDPLAVCIGCGCDDEQACEGGCHWLRVDYDRGEGVCSNCEEFTGAFDAETPELILPGTEAYAETVAEFRRR